MRTNMTESRSVGLPYGPADFPGRLPEGLTYHYWDGHAAFPADPAELRFLVPPPVPEMQQRILGRLLPHVERLDVLQVLSSGHDYLEPYLHLLPGAAQVATARGVHGETTAELAVTLLLAAARGLDHFVRQQSARQWQPRRFTTVYGKRVLVVGQGPVGSAVATRLAPFGCRVIRMARTA